MDIGSENHGQVLLLRPEGRLDTETAGELELALHDAFESGRRHFVLDLARISYVSSAGLRVLLALAKKLDGDIGTLRLAALNASVKQVFDIAGFTSLFDIRSNHKAALDKHPFIAAPVDAVAPAVAATAANPVVSAAASLLGATQPAAAVSAEQKATADAAARLLGVSAAAAIVPAKADAPNRATVVGGPADPRLQTAAEQAESAKPKEPAPAGKPGMFSRLLGKK
jgi:anti-anti-sigma factor